MLEPRAELEPGREFRGWRGSEMEPFSGDWVIESELPGMQHQPWCMSGVLFSVNRIAEDGGSFVMEVDADLVGAASVQVAKHQSGFCLGIGCENFVIGDRGFAAGRIYHGHFLSVHRVPPDVGENGILFRVGNAVSDRQVEFFHGGALGELGYQAFMRGICFRNHEAARGIFVEAVDDAGSRLAADLREFSPTMMQQCIDQGAIGIAGGWMDHDAVLLMHN